MMEELSPINHVRPGVPPTLLTYDDPLDAPYGIHHPELRGSVEGEDPGRRGPLRPGGRRRPLADSRTKSIPAFLLDELKGPGSG